jgi:membrane-associated phospholipid phosphatase
LHTAIYDAVNSIDRSHQSYHFKPEPPAGASIDAAAVGAASEVMQKLYPPLRARTDTLYNNFIAAQSRTAALTNSMTFGRNIAQLALQSRSNDGAATLVTYIPKNTPGQWRRTPPFFRPPLDPQWRYLRPFCLTNIASFVPGPPPGIGSPEYAQALNEVKALGAKSSDLRTADQSQIAVFWSDFSYTAMPPGHWYEIACEIARDQQLRLAETARLFALISLSQADSAIVCWEAKYRYNFWRPVTAIQRADEDGNTATDADTKWEQNLASPPFPSYISGHSTFSKAVATVLTVFFGRDSISFTATSDSLPGVTRQYSSLSACADEVGMSRIYGGIHFQFDNREGKLCGQKIAEYVCANFLLPNRQEPVENVSTHAR